MDDPFAARRAAREISEKNDRSIAEADRIMRGSLAWPGRKEPIPAIDPDPEIVKLDGTAQATVSTRWLAALCEWAVRNYEDES